jgi:hypothetical protein
MVAEPTATGRMFSLGVNNNNNNNNKSVYFSSGKISSDESQHSAHEVTMIQQSPIDTYHPQVTNGIHLHNISS